MSSFLLLESGSHLLLEQGDDLLLEDHVAVTEFDRAASLSATGSVASAGEFFSVESRAAAVAASGALTTVGQRDLLRSSAVGATATVTVSGTSWTELERATAFDATGAIASAAVVSDLAFVSDSFTDTNGTLLQSHTGEGGATWTRHSVSGTVNAQIANNRLRVSATSSIALYYASGVPPAAEYDVQGVVYVASLSADSFNGICGRLSLAANTMYLARYSKTAGQWQLLKFVAGTTTTLGTYTQSLSVGGSYVVKLQIRDAAKKVFIDGVERISSSDNAVTAAGRVGVRLFDSAASDTTGFHIDSLVAVDALQRSAALAASGALTVVGQRDVLRSSAVVAIGAVEAAGQRDLQRTVSFDATATVATAGEVEGGLVVHERSATVSATATIATAGVFWSTLTGTVALAATGTVGSVGQRELSRSASVTATGTLSAEAVVVGPPAVVVGALVVSDSASYSLSAPHSARIALVTSTQRAERTRLIVTDQTCTNLNAETRAVVAV